MSCSLPIDDLKKLIRDEIQEFVFEHLHGRGSTESAYIEFLKNKIIENPLINTECKIYIDYGKDQLYNRKMVHPCHSLRYVMKEPKKNFQVGEMTEFNFLTFDESKIKFCPYCGVKFA